MFREKVSIVKAGDDLRDSVEKASGNLGGLGRYVQAGDRVVLKPNLVTARTPDTGATTSLAIVEAVAGMVRDLGATPVIYDIPAMEFERSKVFRALGIGEWAKRLGVEVVEESDVVNIEAHGSGFLKRLRLPRLILESKIINLPKLKTHVSATMSCAIKNLVGVLPDEQRRWLHIYGVHEPLADLTEVISPVMTIVDATTCMQGLGPSYGDAIQLGLIVAGADMVSVDEVCAMLIGLDPLQIGYLRTIRERYGERPVEVVGEQIEEVSLPFNIPSGSGKMDLFFRAMYLTDSLFFRHISRYPLNRVLYSTGRVGTNVAIDAKRCDKCGKCIGACPVPGAIDPDDYHIDYKACVRCLNCLYACEKQAVMVAGISKPEAIGDRVEGVPAKE